MKSSYTQLGIIDAPTDFVHALSFSLDGRYLASATNDEVVRVYDIQRGFTTIWEDKGPCPATAVMWRDCTLFVGRMDGVVICVYPTNSWLRRRKSEVIYKADEPISAMEFNTRGDHLLVCSGADVLFFQKASKKWKYYDLIPRPSAFGEFNDDVYPILATGAHFLENDDACLISYLHNGFWELKLDTWESISRWGPRDSYDLGDSRRHFGRIATSAKSPDSRSVVAANLCQGLDWFKIMPDRLKKMSTTHQPQQINIPLPVLFIDHGQAVIMGSTNGCALILEVKHGEKVQALKHGSDQTWVTSLAYIEPVGHSRMIATGDGNRGQRTKIILWIENSEKSSSKFSRSWIVILKIVSRPP
ncbi:WD40-repeat-containing domain protein [Lentinula detonsa]|uniref:WD40-repeat-containing domain protein n=1 Tax=Lentinula detonsa TaxID=2804962 RepID=A0A9W8U134_9AGAR|nr:WD40-repeat-containing domain protein [Lentinula detonsa]